MTNQYRQNEPFTKYLDDYAIQYKKSKVIDYSFIFAISQYHYFQNQLYDPSFIGLSKKGITNTANIATNTIPFTSPSNVTEQVSLTERNSTFRRDKDRNPYSTDQYYINYSNSEWNKLAISYGSNNTNGITVNQSWFPMYYNQFTAPQYDMSFSFYNEPLETVIQKKEYIHIDVSMQTLQDILKVIDEYPLEENMNSPIKEYNIDLKSLHNIKPELQELNTMIGMNTIKQSILEQLLYFIQELHIGKKISEFKHTAIYGSPGTGKTEVAKIIGRMYSKLGILKNNIFKKVTRNDLIAGYLGQTAIKTKKVIDECLGGVLFIDEAYSLGCADGNDSYSKECIDTICEALSDHKDDLMVIIAGYEEELNNTFFNLNKGLPSRFIWRFTMDSYDSKELLQIFKKMILEQEWLFTDDMKLTEKWFQEKKENFMNYGRDMELLLTYSKIAHGTRIFGKPKEMRKRISLEDMNRGYETFLKNKKTKKEPNFMHSIYV
jgi:SpoVK/Ycf46/Vps4 family AAA+-type ATPase